MCIFRKAEPAAVVVVANHFISRTENAASFYRSNSRDITVVVAMTERLAEWRLAAILMFRRMRGPLWCHYSDMM